MDSSNRITPFTVVYAPSDGVTAAAYPEAVGLPVIFDRRPGMQRLALRFLIDLAYAKWRFPEGFHEKAGAKRPARKSMHATAERLANFLDWAERRTLDLHSCNYNQGIARYQQEMLSGVWSRHGDALAPATINVRVDVAVQYLRWMADIGERTQFDVLTKEVTQSYGRHDNSRRSTKTMVVREGRIQPKPKVLALPTKPQVIEWLNKGKELEGPTFALMAQSILRTGIRLKETVCLRVDSLPLDPADWEVVNPTQPTHLQEVVIKLEWGCKGGALWQCPNTGDELKNGRNIRVPLTLAQEWHQYRLKARVKAVAKRLEGLKGKQREELAASLVHLFLRDDDGHRWNGKALYDAWCSVPREFAGKWHPHIGRHWWACMTLWDEIQRLDTDGRSKENLLSIIRTRIQPQLGHVSEETTLLYLRWVINQLGAPLVLDETDEEMS